MPQKFCSAMRKRRHEHLMDTLLKGGKLERLAQEIAARIIKERAQYHESLTSSAASINDTSSGRRGGLLSDLGTGE